MSEIIQKAIEESRERQKFIGRLWGGEGVLEGCSTFEQNRISIHCSEHLAAVAEPRFRDALEECMNLLGPMSREKSTIAGRQFTFSQHAVLAQAALSRVEAILRSNK